MKTHCVRCGSAAQEMTTIFAVKLHYRCDGGMILRKREGLCCHSCVESEKAYPLDVGYIRFDRQYTAYEIKRMRREFRLILGAGVQGSPQFGSHS